MLSILNDLILELIIIQNFLKHLQYSLIWTKSTMYMLWIKVKQKIHHHFVCSVLSLCTHIQYWLGSGAQKGCQIFPKRIRLFLSSGAFRDSLGRANKWGFLAALILHTKIIQMCLHEIRLVILCYTTLYGLIINKCKLFLSFYCCSHWNLGTDIIAVRKLRGKLFFHSWCFPDAFNYSSLQ